MEFKIKAFQVMQYVPGLGSGTYQVGQANIVRLEQVEQGVIVFRERGGVETHKPTLITWPLIKWAHIEEVVEPKKASKSK